MTPSEMIEIDRKVRDALDVKAGETINEAARRVIAAGEMGRKRLCATIIVAMKREPWETMRVAARVLEWGGTR